MQSLQADTDRNRDQYDALVRGMYDDPFALLGVHQSDNRRVVRVFQPAAAAVDMLSGDGELLKSMDRVHDGGVFCAFMPPRLRNYRLRVRYVDGNEQIIEDSYRFPSTLGEQDLYYLGEGRHESNYYALGAHEMTVLGVAGTRFAVWAPNASRVSVVADFNAWDGRLHVMRKHPGNGIWELFMPGVGTGTHYKYELLDRRGTLLPLKNDPFGSYFEAPPGNASIVFSSRYTWQDQAWMHGRRPAAGLASPVSIYEVHAGSWRRKQDNATLSYRDLAHELVEYVSGMGYTHIELLPVTEHPFDGSWGYQPIGMFAPTQRFGNPDDFRYFVDCCHAAGISVIIDWVPAHFPKDEHGLGRFDGTALYEHEDPRRGEHADWGTLIFNYGRSEVMNYLIGSALYWLREFHIDALRVDAVASMLYLDYSRKDGEWLPNVHGGNENLEAVAFLKRANETLHANGGETFAEESTAWPAVSRPTYAGGLGFTYKWNMGWMHDTLSYMQEEPVHRKYHHDKMTFGLVYAFNENFVLPLSHDEVVHGKRSILGRMPGDEWQRFANLRAYYGFMYGHPGKKLLFMGGEFAQSSEWNHDRSLDWHLLQYDYHRGVQELVRALNQAYAALPALHELDFEPRGFEWISWDDSDNSVFSWIRRAGNGEFVVCISNFTPVVREGYRLGVPSQGRYELLLNTDAAEFAGSGADIGTAWQTRQFASHGRDHSIEVTLPPLATIILRPGAAATETE